MKGKNSRIEKMVVAIIGIIAGAITVLFGIMLSKPSVGVGDIKEFGADFYTEIYSITKITAQNTAHVVDIIYDFAKYLLISLGVFEILFFVYKLVGIGNESDSVKLKKSEYEEVKEIEDELPEL